MGEYRRRAEEWLAHEQRGLDDAADEALALVFAAAPVAEPSASFVQRTVEASWQARTRRRQRAIAAGVAASLVAVLGGAAAYGVASVASGWLLTMIATAATSAVLFTVTTVAAILDWWAAGARIGSAVIAVMALPQGVAMLAAIELAGAGALYLLHRLLRTDVRWHRPGPLCV